MQFSVFAAAAALASVVAAAGNVTYTTEVIYETTTYCPALTTLSFAGTTIEVTSTGIVTIPCPCTVSHLVTPSGTPAPMIAASTGAAYTNGTAATATSAVAGTGASSATKATGTAVYSGAANHVAAGSMAGLAGLAGLAAFL